MNLRARLNTYMAGETALPVLVLFALNAVDEFDTALFENLGPEIAKDFNVGVGVFGSITVLVVILVPFVSVPIAHLADRRSRMPMAIMGAAAWGMFSLASGLAPALWLLIACRVGSGFGKVVNEPVHGGLLADFYSPKARAQAFGIHSLANPLGAAVAAVLGGVIAQVYGWRLAFMLLALPTFVVLLWARRLPEPERGQHEEAPPGETPGMGETAGRLWAIRSLRYQYIGFAFAAGSILGIGVLIPFFLEEEFGLGPGTRGVLTGIGTLLSAAFVLIGTKVIQHRFVASPADSLRLLSKVGIIAGVCLLVAAASPALWLVMLMIWTIMCSIAFVLPGLRALITVVAPSELRSSAFAFAGLVALAGSGFSIVGFAVGNSNIRLALALMSPVFLRGIGFFLKAATYLDDDVARLRHGEDLSVAGPEGRSLLEVRGLTVSYDGVQVLFGVDLDVREGEIVALLGTNGAGKSTTLNAISGLHEPDGGNIWFDGQPIVGLAPERTVKRGLVQVPGGRGVFPGLTVAENLEMGSFLLRGDRPLARRRIGEVVELFPRLGERMTQRAGSLSGGERQMLTLAQSFLIQPKLMLIDELSLGLAPTIVQELLDTVRRLNAAGVSIVLVEQSVNVALTLADRAYFMEKGEVRFSGPTAALLERPDILRSVFLEGMRTT